MTLSDLLYISGSPITLEFHDYWYYKNDETEIIINKKTKKRILCDFTFEKPLTQQLGTQLGGVDFNIFNNEGIKIYNETLSYMGWIEWSRAPIVHKAQDGRIFNLLAEKKQKPLGFNCSVL